MKTKELLQSKAAMLRGQITLSEESLTSFKELAGDDTTEGIISAIVAKKTRLTNLRNYLAETEAMLAA